MVYIRHPSKCQSHPPLAGYPHPTQIISVILRSLYDILKRVCDTGAMMIFFPNRILGPHCFLIWSTIILFSATYFPRPNYINKGSLFFKSSIGFNIWWFRWYFRVWVQPYCNLRLCMIFWWHIKVLHHSTVFIMWLNEDID